MGNFTNCNDNFQERGVSEKPVWGVMFVSRNKDNKNIDGFKERRQCFLSTKVHDKEYMDNKQNINVRRMIS